MGIAIIMTGASSAVSSCLRISEKGQREMVLLQDKQTNEVMAEKKTGITGEQWQL